MNQNIEDQVAKIIIKVYLVSGKEKTHTYEAPTSKKELKEFIVNMVGRTAALVRDRVGFLHFEEPNIFYNANNVEGIELSSIGIKELESLIRKAQTETGFIKE